MEITTYNKHHSAPFLRALVDHLRQVYSVEGSRRRYPINKFLSPAIDRSLPARLWGSNDPIKAKDLFMIALLLHATTEAESLGELDSM
jgi:hypothetical protein